MDKLIIVPAHTTQHLTLTSLASSDESYTIQVHEHAQITISMALSDVQGSLRVSCYLLGTSSSCLMNGHIYARNDDKFACYIEQYH